MTTSDAPRTMLPAESYTSAEVWQWERRHLFAGGWTCLGRLDDLLGSGITQRAVMVGDVSALLVLGDGRGPDVRQHLPAPRPRAAAGGGVVAPPGDGVPVPRLELRPGRGR